MCFSIGQSAAMCSAAALASLILFITGRPAKYVLLPAYFALMEVSALPAAFCVSSLLITTVMSESRYTLTHWYYLGLLDTSVLLLHMRMCHAHVTCLLHEYLLSWRLSLFTLCGACHLI
jgi:hypothetical protein